MDSNVPSNFNHSTILWLPKKSVAGGQLVHCNHWVLSNKIWRRNYVISMDILWLPLREYGTKEHQFYKQIPHRQVQFRLIIHLQTHPCCKNICNQCLTCRWVAVSSEGNSNIKMLPVVYFYYDCKLHKILHGPICIFLIVGPRLHLPVYCHGSIQFSAEAGK